MDTQKDAVIERSFRSCAEFLEYLFSNERHLYFVEVIAQQSEGNKFLLSNDRTALFERLLNAKEPVRAEWRDWETHYPDFLADLEDRGETERLKVGGEWVISFTEDCDLHDLTYAALERLGCSENRNVDPQIIVECFWDEFEKTMDNGCGDFWCSYLNVLRTIKWQLEDEREQSEAFLDSEISDDDVIAYVSKFIATKPSFNNIDPKSLFAEGALLNSQK